MLVRSSVDEVEIGVVTLTRRATVFWRSATVLLGGTVCGSSIISPLSRFCTIRKICSFTALVSNRWPYTSVW